MCRLVSSWFSNLLMIKRFDHFKKEKTQVAKLFSSGICTVL